MFKTFATAFLAVSSSVAFAGPAQACGHRGCAPTCAAPAASATASAAPAPAPQTAGTGTYQSFSYEPGAVTQPQPVVAPRFAPTTGPTNWSMRQNAAAFGKMR